MANVLALAPPLRLDEYERDSKYVQDTVAVSLAPDDAMIQVVDLSSVSLVIFPWGWEF
jgi:hypothetical protein